MVYNNTVQFANLLNGSLIDAPSATYTAILGEWYWFILLIMFFIVVYIKTRSEAMVGIMALIVGGILATTIPTNSLNLVYMLIVFGLGIFFWKAYNKG